MNTYTITLTSEERSALHEMLVDWKIRFDRTHTSWSAQRAQNANLRTLVESALPDPF